MKKLTDIERTAIFEYLKDNLSIQVETKEETDYYTDSKYISVGVYLEDKLISESSDVVPNG